MAIINRALEVCQTGRSPNPRKVVAVMLPHPNRQRLAILLLSTLLMGLLAACSSLETVEDEDEGFEEATRQTLEDEGFEEATRQMLEAEGFEEATRQMLSPLRSYKSELDELVSDLQSLDNPVSSEEESDTLVVSVRDLRNDVWNFSQEVYGIWDRTELTINDINAGHGEPAQRELQFAIDDASELLDPLPDIFDRGEALIEQARAMGVEIDPRLPDRLEYSRSLVTEVLTAID